MSAEQLITTSRFPFRTSTIVRTIPRSGFDRDGRASVTVARMDKVSPGRTGRSQRSSSSPAAPGIEAAREGNRLRLLDRDRPELAGRADDAVLETALRGVRPRLPVRTVHGISSGGLTFRKAP